MKIFHNVFLFLIFLFVTACGTQITPTSVPVPVPDPGKATVSGRLYSITSGQVLPNTAVWLAEVVRQGEQGAYVLDTAFSPGIYTDENGVFVISNIVPGEYVIVVGDPESKHEIILESQDEAKVWNIPADQIYDIGELKVKLTE